MAHRVPEECLDSWEEHRREQLKLSLRATPAQRLAWLEEMMQLAYRRRLAIGSSTDE